jgi:hypothetical protein
MGGGNKVGMKRKWGGWMGVGAKRLAIAASLFV